MISEAPSQLGQAVREDGSAPCEFTNCIDACSVSDRASMELKKFDNKTFEDGGVWSTLDGVAGTLPLDSGGVRGSDLVEGSASDESSIPVVACSLPIRLAFFF